MGENYGNQKKISSIRSGSLPMCQSSVQHRIYKFDVVRLTETWVRDDGPTYDGGG